jgi:hypothetical protein
VAAAPHAGCFGEDAEFLAAPPKPGFRVQNAHSEAPRRRLRMRDDDRRPAIR